jgi:hypothetical protein
MRKESGDAGRHLEEQGMLAGAVDDKELQELEQKLQGTIRSYEAAKPGEADTERLLAMLQPEFDLLKGETELPLHHLPLLDRPSLSRYWLRLAGTLGKSFWLASAAVFVMLTLISRGQSLENMGSLFSLLMPLFMMLCIGYGYRTWNRQMREVESITPFPPALQLLSRLLMAVAVNLGFGLASSLYLDVAVREFAVLPFLLNWLSELMLVGGVLASVLFYKGMKTGFAAGTLVWFLFQTPWWPEKWLYEQSLSDAAVYGVQFAALCLGLALFVIAYRKCTHIRWMDPS